MFCSSCGKEVQEGWTICPQCGKKLKEKTNIQEPIHMEKAKKKPKKLWILLGIIVVLIFGIMMVNTSDSEIKPSSSAEQDVIDKLQTFTAAYEEDGKYYFLDNDGEWALTYTSGNEFVIFENNTVIECFTEAFGAGCFSKNSVSNVGFGYDLSDDEARIYFDVDIEDGHLTIVSYNLADKEYELMIDGDKWSPTDEFVDFVEKYGLAQSIESDVKGFKTLLQQYELTIEDLLCIKFDTLKSQFIPDMAESKSEIIHDEKETMGDSETANSQTTNPSTTTAETEINLNTSNSEKNISSVPITYGTYSYDNGTDAINEASVGFYTDSGEDYVFIDCWGYGGHELIFFEGILEEKDDGSYYAYSEEFETGIVVTFVDSGLYVEILDSNMSSMYYLEGFYVLGSSLNLDEVG